MMLSPDNVPAISVIKQSGYKRMPWKNGLGETLEIYTLEDTTGLRLRISQAAVVEDCMFSQFSGLHRSLVLLSGDGMTLKHSLLKSPFLKPDLLKKDTQHSVSDNDLHSTVVIALEAPLDIARFSGGDLTYATLKNGAIEDLNIMVRQSDTCSEVAACFAPKRMNISSDNACIMSGFYANQDCSIAVNDIEKLQLQAHSFLLIEQAQYLYLSQGSGVFIQVLETTVLN